MHARIFAKSPVLAKGQLDRKPAGEALMWFQRRVIIVRRSTFSLPVPQAPASLWERVPHFVLVILAVFGGMMGAVAARALNGGVVGQCILACIGGIFGFYFLKILPKIYVLLIYGVALAVMVAIAVWLDHLFVH